MIGEVGPDRPRRAVERVASGCVGAVAEPQDLEQRQALFEGPRRAHLRGQLGRDSPCGHTWDTNQAQHRIKPHPAPEPSAGQASVVKNAHP
jgi:hypothetical protein